MSILDAPAATLAPSGSSLWIPPQGSNPIEARGDKAVIRSLELFCAFDARFDSESNKKVAQFTNERTREVYEQTTARMKKGQRPQVVLFHDDGRPVPTECIGTVVSLWCEERDGVTYIMGDVEMPIFAFDTYIRTNAFPRRSAEILMPQGWLAQVTLQGRDAPGRPLADTRFTAGSHSESFHPPVAPLVIEAGEASQHSYGAIGGGNNTYIPGDTGKEAKMADETKAKTIEERVAALEELCSKMAAKFTDAAPKDEGKGDDKDAASMHTDAGERTDFTALQSQNNALAAQLEAMRGELLLEKFSAKIDAAIQQGYAALKDRKSEVLSDVVAAKDPQARLDFVLSLLPRDPIGVRLERGFVEGPGNQSINRTDMKAAVAEAVKFTAETVSASAGPEERRKVYLTKLNELTNGAIA